MGSGGYSYDSALSLRAAAKKAGHTSTFIHNDKIRSGVIDAIIHESVDPLKIKGVRESCDSAEHPNSVPVAVFLDVTGSMSNSPKMVMDEFPKLMAAIIKDGMLNDPQLLFGAIGDAYCDSMPFQVTQFESDNRTEEQISNFYLEGGGGGNRHESYDLPMYFLARKTKCDAWEKRGKKGYAFLVQDEPPPSVLPKSHVKQVFGDAIEADVSFKDIIAEAEEKWDIFILRLQTTSYGSNSGVTQQWKELFGERVISLENEAAVCATIALIIAGCEGTSLDDVAKDVGASAKTLSNVKSIVLRPEGAIVKGAGNATGTIAVAAGNAADRDF